MVQHCLALSVWLVCLVMPRPGAAVLLIPIAASPGYLRFATGLVVLRAGAIPGSLLVQVSGTIPVLSLIGHGVLPLAAPTWLCGATTRTPAAISVQPNH